MPTALELTREGWGQYLKATSPGPSPPTLKPEQKQEHKLLLGRVTAAADMLKKRYRVRRVLLFGSLAHKAWMNPDSDVDIVVEGLAGEDYWEAWRFTEEMIQSHPIDLIEIEAVSDSMLSAIERYGLEL